MKKMFLFVFALLLINAAYAQHGYSTATNMNFVPNGHRSVAEENAEMERVMAERRKQAAKEEGIPYVAPKFEYYHEPKPAANKPSTSSTAKRKPATKTAAR